MQDIWGRTVTVETQGYENRTGRRPYGRGEWAFHFGGYAYGHELSVDFTFFGLYSEAKKAAIKQAAQSGYSLVVVCA